MKLLLPSSHSANHRLSLPILAGFGDWFFAFLWCGQIPKDAQKNPGQQTWLDISLREEEEDVVKDGGRLFFLHLFLDELAL